MWDEMLSLKSCCSTPTAHTSLRGRTTCQGLGKSGRQGLRTGRTRSHLGVKTRSTTAPRHVLGWAFGFCSTPFLISHIIGGSIFSTQTLPNSFLECQRGRVTMAMATTGWKWDEMWGGMCKWVFSCGTQFFWQRVQVRCNSKDRCSLYRSEVHTQVDRWRVERSRLWCLLTHIEQLGELHLERLQETRMNKFVCAQCETFTGQSKCVSSAGSPGTGTLASTENSWMRTGQCCWPWAAMEWNWMEMRTTTLRGQRASPEILTRCAVQRTSRWTIWTPRGTCPVHVRPDRASKSSTRIGRRARRKTECRRMVRDEFAGGEFTAWPEWQWVTQTRSRALVYGVGAPGEGVEIGRKSFDAELTSITDVFKRSVVLKSTMSRCS